MTDTYILQGKKPAPEPDFSAWRSWHRTAEPYVGYAEVGHLRISTVFLGLNQSPFRHAPLLLETMIFGKGTKYQERCSTWEQAEEMHKRAVEHARSLLPKPR